MKWAGVLLISYYFAVFGYRAAVRGVAGALDMIWLCNVALLLSGIGILIDSAALVRASVASVTFAHVSWNLDVLSYFTTGVFPFATASYIIWPQTSYWELITTLHHVWYMPLMFVILRDHYRTPLTHYDWIIGSAIPIALIPLTYYFTPIEYDGVYLNINLAHEFWKESSGWLGSWNESQFYHVFLSFLGSTLNLISLWVVMGAYWLCCTKIRGEKRHKKEL